MLLRDQVLLKVLCLRELFGRGKGRPCSDSSSGGSTIGEQGRSPVWTTVPVVVAQVRTRWFYSEAADSACSL